MSTSGKPMIQIGGLYLNPQNILSSVSREIPYLLINTRNFEDKQPDGAKDVEEAIRNVIEYVNNLKESKD